MNEEEDKELEGDVSIKRGISSIKGHYNRREDCPEKIRGGGSVAH